MSISRVLYDKDRKRQQHKGEKIETRGSVRNGNSEKGKCILLVGGILGYFGHFYVEKYVISWEEPLKPKKLMNVRI